MATDPAGFAATYGDAATAAGQALNVSPALVLSQWALESGYGTSPAASRGNLAGLQTGGVNRTYGGLDQFVSDYVSTIKNYFPGAVGAGSSADAFVTGLTAKSAGGSGILGNYFGPATPSSYEAGILGAASTLSANTPSTAGLGQVYGTVNGMPQGVNLGNSTGNPLVPVSPTAQGPGTPGDTTSACGGGTLGLGGFFTWACWANVAADAGLVVLGLGMILIGVMAGVRGGPAVVVEQVTGHRG